MSKKPTMADRPVLIVVQNAIVKPDETWPRIHEHIFQVLHKLKADHARFTLQTSQELRAIDRLAAFYVVRLQLQGMLQIQKSWQHTWLDMLMRIILEHPTIHGDWFPTTGRRPNVIDWKLDGCVGLIVVRTNVEPVMFTPLVERAIQLDIPTVRIDPESDEVVLMKKPMKENERDTHTAGD